MRVADLKNVSAFSSNIQDHSNQRLARALGYLDDDIKRATERFLHEYVQVTRTVRGHFTALVGELENQGLGGRYS